MFAFRAFNLNFNSLTLSRSLKMRSSIFHLKFMKLLWEL